MDTRKKIPDILDEKIEKKTQKINLTQSKLKKDILGEVISGGKEIGEKTQKLGLGQSELKEKATHTFPVAILAELEEKVAKFRTATGTKVTKTMVIVEALREAFADFDKHGEQGRFFLCILKQQKSQSFKKMEQKLKKRENELLQLRKEFVLQSNTVS